MNYLKYVDIIKNKTFQKCALGSVFAFSIVSGIGYLVKNEILQYFKNIDECEKDKTDKKIDECEDKTDKKIDDCEDKTDKKIDDCENEIDKKTDDCENEINKKIDDCGEFGNKLNCKLNEYINELNKDEKLLDTVKFMEIDV